MGSEIIKTKICVTAKHLASPSAPLTCAGRALGFAGRVIVGVTAANDAARFKGRRDLDVQLREAVFTSLGALSFRHYRNQKLQLMRAAAYLRYNTGAKCFDCEKQKRMNHLWRTEKTSRQRKGKPREAAELCQVLFQKGTVNRGTARYGIRRCTDRSCSRSPSCRPCRGRSPAYWGLLSEPPLWTASYNPDLTGLLEDREERHRGG